MDKKASLKWAWSRDVIHFKFLVFSKMSLERLKLETSSLNLVCVVDHSKFQPTDENPSLKGAWLGHVDHLNFGGHQPYLWNG